MPAGTTERRLAAIMFTDIVGYTALMARDEEAGRRARDRHEAVVRPMVERYHGAWIERTGDETLSSFPSALDAVNCALAVQAELDGDADLRLRIGIHQGDVTFDARGVSGDGVNVAARVRPHAEPGGLAISDEVHQSVRGRPNLEFRPLGEQEFKNVDHPVAVFAVTGTAAPPPLSKPAAPLGRGALARPGVRWTTALGALLLIGLAVGWWRYEVVPSTGPIRSIAVLPLDDPSAAEAEGYLSFGMTEALIAELGRIEDLRVISRTSVTPYEATILPLRQIAEELGVDAIIEGSVLRSGDRVRISAQLIDARTDTNLWAESYDRDLGDVLALLAEVAREIARQVQVEVSPAVQVATPSTHPMSPEAYEAYLKGYYFQMKRTREDTLRAMRYFHEVIRREPNHPLGYSGLADEYSCVPTHSWSIAESELWPSVPREMIARARENAQKAVELDPMSGPARNSVALVRMFGDWDWPSAEAEFRKALALSPGRAWAYSTYGLFLAFQGRFDEAMRHLEQARALDPLRVETTMDMAALHAFTGEPEEAYRWWKKAQEIDPTYAGLHQAVISGFCGTERHVEALVALEGANAKHPDDPLILAEMAYCHAVAGDEARAQDLLAETKGLADTMYVSPVSRAMVYVGLGDHDRAFDELEEGMDQRDFLLLYLGVDSPWDPLRSDPRFDDLLRRIGYPES